MMWRCDVGGCVGGYVGGVRWGGVGGVGNLVEIEDEVELANVAEELIEEFDE